MKVRIDFSVYTASEAIGNVEGEIVCVVEPQIDDTISFMFSPGGKGIPHGHQAGGLLKVEGRIIRPNQMDVPLSLSLSDMVVDTREHALALMRFFESGYNLFVNIYGEDDRP